MILLKTYYLFSIFSLAAGLFLIFQLLVGYQNKEHSKCHFLGFMLIAVAVHLESILVWSTWITPARNVVLRTSALIPVALFFQCKIFETGKKNLPFEKPVLTIILPLSIVFLSFIPSTNPGIASLSSMLIFVTQGVLLFKKRFFQFRQEQKRIATIISLVWWFFLPIILLNGIPKLNLPKATALFVTTGMNLQMIFSLRLFLFDNKQYETVFKIAKIKYQTNPIATTDSSDIKDRLLKLMNAKRPFLDSALSLETLSKSIDTTPHKLSQVLNKEFGVNFNDFVNNYRINHACDLLKKDPSAKILAVAYDCGFNNKNTFNQAFKKQTAITPSQFAQKIKSSKTGQ